MRDVKILIVSNNCLSQHNSNGRTLLNMLGGFKREMMCQIYTSGECIKNEFCENSYRITNRDAIKSYLGKKPKNSVQVNFLDEKQEKPKISRRKSATTMLLRDLVWDWSVLLSEALIEWSRDQKPQVVLLQLGDSTHLIKIAMSISEKLNIPLITFNTEDYYFKNFDYMKKELKSNFMYEVFHKRFCKKFELMMKNSSMNFYNCEGLRELYDKNFKTESEVVYCSTNISTVNSINMNGSIVYAGNLGVGRHRPLIEIGKVLDSLNLYIDVYGVAEENVVKEFNNAKGVKYHGFVSYEELREIIAESRLLIHVESFDEYYSIDTKYAFSTKIADYCGAGIPFLVYAPEWCESTAYVQKYDIAFIAIDSACLVQRLKEALFDKEEQKHKVQNALKIAKKNHNFYKNAVRVKEKIEHCTLRKYKVE